MPKTISVTISDDTWLALANIQHELLLSSQKKVSLSKIISDIVDENLKDKKATQ
ncbi:MAG: hypothetical protein Q8K92_26630 [Leadbetterella sp.]|nr:hypothetical protein [Leadbetterella sp.]